MNISIEKVPGLEANEATSGLCVSRDHLLVTSMETFFGRGQFCYMLLCMLLLMYFSAQLVKNHINVDEPKISKVKVVYHNPVCCI